VSTDKALRALAEEIESDQPWPRPRCPTCGDGQIGFSQPETFETEDSLAAHDHPAFEPEWIGGTFVIRGHCENPRCNQVVQAGGSWRVAYAQKSGQFFPECHNEQYATFHRVEHMYPAPTIMEIPERAPDDVARGVLRASRVLLSDPGLAATALRSAVELFLTAQGVPGIQASGRFRPLDDRIKEWKKGDANRSQVADLLLAVKWIGNKGTHEDSELALVEVLEGAALLDEAFHRTYAGPDLDAKARSVIEKHGKS